MTALMETLKASILLEAIREIQQIADDAADIDNNGGPNVAMRILIIARDAAAKVKGRP